MHASHIYMYKYTHVCTYTCVSVLSAITLSIALYAPWKSPHKARWPYVRVGIFNSVLGKKPLEKAHTERFIHQFTHMHVYICTYTHVMHEYLHIHTNVMSQCVLQTEIRVRMCTFIHTQCMKICISVPSPTALSSAPYRQKYVYACVYL